MTDKKIDALPTKELFIDMLTRDIPLIPAIIDLVDNSADGARKLKRSGRYKGLWVRLEISPEQFRISDNCGGITVEIARKYAFRFGRPKGMPSVEHSVGEFGVGMKRAIFKMGSQFTVKSTTKSSRFAVEEDVVEWAKKDEWTFKFSELKEKIAVRKDEIGTTIAITALHKDVSESFGLENFKTELQEELKVRLLDPITRGLSISVDGIPLGAEALKLLSSTQLAPAYKELRFPKSGGTKPLNVKLYCGLGEESDPELAGWHVFCNGRLVLKADKDDVTGWGAGKAQGGVSIPGFHGQYNYLRGYAYFDSDDPGNLPWNTTKTDLNTDSPGYRAAKPEMMRLMRPVVNFLNKLKDEKAGKDEEDEDKGPLELLIQKSEAKTVTKVKTRDTFKVSAAARTASGPKKQRIQYDKPSDQVAKVKKALGVRSFTKVGEKTFDYYYNAEVDE